MWTQSIIWHKQEQSFPLSPTVHELSVIKIVYRMKFITYSKPSKTTAMLERHDLRARNKPVTTSEKPMVVALFPYEHLTFNKISRLLAKRNIKTIYIPRKKKTSCSLRLIKDNLGLKTSGVCVRARVRACVRLWEGGETLPGPLISDAKNTQDTCAMARQKSQL